MPISHNKKIIFIHIPKNAGTAITDTEGMGFIHIGHHLPNFYQSNFPNEWNRYVKFGVVRNPWDRVVSNYEYGRMAESHWHSVSGNSQYGTHPDYQKLISLTFKESLIKLSEDRNYFKHQGWEPQHIYTHKDDNLLLDYVFDVSELKDNTDFESLVPNLLYKNKSNKKHSNYKDYYDDETIKIVSEIYSKDIELFNFNF